MSACAERRGDLAAHALGALEPGPAAEVERHLRTCAGCAAEAAELAGPVALLALVPAGRAAGGVPPVGPGFADRLVAAAARRRRARRRWVGGAVALAAAGAGLLAATVTTTSPAHRPPAERLAAADARTGVGVEVTLRPRPTGTAISLRIHGVPSGATCTLVAVARDGRSSPAGSWRAGYSGTAAVEGSTGIAEADLARLVVDTTAGDQLVVVPVAPAR